MAGKWLGEQEIDEIWLPFGWDTNYVAAKCPRVPESNNVLRDIRLQNKYAVPDSPMVYPGAGVGVHQ
jgi:hypothetical protein